MSDGGLTGLTATGKTSLTNQYITPPNYNDSYYPTIETTMNKTVTFQGNEYECEIIDSAGQVSCIRSFQN